jgi:hypothetical protein
MKPKWPAGVRPDHYVAGFTSFISPDAGDFLAVDHAPSLRTSPWSNGNASCRPPMSSSTPSVRTPSRSGRRPSSAPKQPDAGTQAKASMPPRTSLDRAQHPGLGRGLCREGLHAPSARAPPPRVSFHPVAVEMPGGAALLKAAGELARYQQQRRRVTYLDTTFHRQRPHQSVSCAVEMQGEWRLGTGRRRLWAPPRGCGGSSQLSWPAHSSRTWCECGDHQAPRGAAASVWPDDL